jgi:predicted membrane protein
MITALDLKSKMSAQPFAPFRLCMSDGKTYDIVNHDMMWVTCNAAFIGINFGPEDVAERSVQCAMLRITRIEDILPQKAA